MFKVFAGAAIIGCTSALTTQVKDIYGNPFNYPDDEVKTPTCTLKVHSVLPDLDVPKVTKKTPTKRTGYDQYGIHDDDDFHFDSGSASGSDQSTNNSGGDTDNSNDMDSSAMMSEMMSGMQEGNNMMSSAMQDTKTKSEDFSWEPKEFK